MTMVWPLISSLHAEDLYVSAGATTGAHSGADWTNAWSSFGEIKWGDGAGKLGAGDTLWIAGGTYTTPLLIGASGKAGSPITIKRVRASDAVPAAAAGWKSAFDAQVVVTAHDSCIYFYQGVGSYVTIDGQVKSGILVNYENGGRGVEIDGNVNFTDIALRYIEAAGPGKIVQTGDTRGFDLTTAALLTNLTVSHCEAHHSDTLIQVTQSVNLLIEYSDFHHSGAINAATYHPNTMYIGSATNATIRYCMLHDMDVEGLFFGDGGNSGINIYGNLFYQGSTSPDTGRGIEFDQTGDTKNVLVYNNTFVGLPLAGVNFNNGQPHPGAVVKNNLFYNCVADFGPAAHDYNWYSGSNNGEPNGIGNGTAPFVNAAAYDYHIVSTVASNKPKDKGANVGAPFNYDRDGNVRGADGAWDMGAYEYASVSNPPPVNTAPTITSVANQTTTSGSSVGPIAFTVGDAQTASSSLTVTAASSNTTLAPSSAITLGGSGANRTVSLTPASGQSGTATITLTVSDGSLSASTSFGLTVTVVNTAPTITSVANQTTTSGSSVGPIAFTVGDAQTAAGSLTVTATSSNTTLVPSSVITLGGSGANRTVSLTPASGQSGTATITLTASDGALSTSTSFGLTVTVVNTAPTITSVANQATTSGSSVGPIAFTVGDAQTAAGSLTVTASSSNTTLLPASGITLGGSGANRTVSLTPASGQSGTATITLTVSDGALSTSTSFGLTVTVVNTAPTITSVANQTTTSGSSVGPIAFTVGDAQTAAGSLTVTAASSNTTLLPSSGIVLGGSSANRTVSLTPASGQSGTATITLTVSDGALNTSTSFGLTVTVVNTAPTITSVANQTTSGGSVGPVAFTVGDAQTAAGSLTVTAASSNTTLVPSSGIVLGGSGANRTVSLTPASGQSGTATITLTVSDGALSTSGSFTLSVSAAPVAANGLVAAYAFSETSGSTVLDASGNGNDGTLQGASRTGSGKYGGALSFNGKSSFVYVAPSASLNLGNTMTLEAWAYPTAKLSGWRTIVQKQVDSYFLHASSNTAMRPAGGGTFGGKMSFATSPSAISANAWTHLAVTYDGARIRLYVNGQLVTNVAQTGSIESNNNGLRIGGNVPYGEYFQGAIDEVRVYNRALSATEIASDMQTPVTAAPVAPAVWSHVDVGAAGSMLAGSDAADTSTGTITINGSGADIGGTADSFRYVYQVLTGDGTVEARVDSLTGPAGAKAGVMIRESLATDARNAFAFVTPAGSAGGQIRVTTGGATSSASAPALSLYWLRLVRAGSTVTAASSPDGVTWTVFATATVSMTDPVYAGFAVTSGSSTSLATAVFSEPFIQ